MTHWDSTCQILFVTKTLSLSAQRLVSVYAIPRLTDFIKRKPLPPCCRSNSAKPKPPYFFLAGEKIKNKSAKSQGKSHFPILFDSPWDILKSYGIMTISYGKNEIRWRYYFRIWCFEILWECENFPWENLKIPWDFNIPMKIKINYIWNCDIPMGFQNMKM